MEKVRIACDVAERIPLDALVPSQGKMKSLSEDNYRALRSAILDTGFAFPFYIWRDLGSGEARIIGGHQRAATLRRMRDEGVEIPELPYISIHAPDLKSARRRILQDASVYGRVDEDGLSKFLQESDIDIETLSSSFRIPDIDFDIVESMLLGDVPRVALRYRIEMVDVSILHNHPDNYRQHGDDELAHIKASIEQNGFYKNVVVAADGTILAGHGAVDAARCLGIRRVPVVRLDIPPSDPRAIRILTGDNEIGHLSTIDDRKLSEILRSILDDGGLIGTGFDEQMLANMVYVTRHSGEIQDQNAAAEWVGLPAYDTEDAESNAATLVLEISFKSADDRVAFVEQTGIQIKDKRGARKWSTCWPFEEKHDLRSVKFEPSDAA